MTKSTVVDNETGKSVDSTVRTSTGTFFGRGQDEVIARIEKRISLVSTACTLACEKGIKPLSSKWQRIVSSRKRQNAVCADQCSRHQLLMRGTQPRKVQICLDKSKLHASRGLSASASSGSRAWIKKQTVAAWIQAMRTGP